MGTVFQIPVETLQSEYFQDNWVWDVDSKAENVKLSTNRRAAYFHINPELNSTGTAGVRGTKGFQSGEHYWEITFLEPPYGTSVMVGIGTKQADLSQENYKYINLIGCDENSWGLSYKGSLWHKGEGQKYCEPFYKQSTVIGVLLNLYEHTLTFYQDGRCLGLAFRDIPACKQEYFPMIASTAAETELEVGIQTCRYSSLHEKCCYLIAQSVERKENIPRLPIPGIIQDYLMQIKSI